MRSSMALVIEHTTVISHRMILYPNQQSYLPEEAWRQLPAGENLIKELRYNDLPYFEDITKGEALDLLEQFDRTRDEFLWGGTMSLGMVADGVIDGMIFERELLSLSELDEYR